jgi:hypothetical protein
MRPGSACSRDLFKILINPVEWQETNAPFGKTQDCGGIRDARAAALLAAYLTNGVHDETWLVETLIQPAVIIHGVAENRVKLRGTAFPGILGSHECLSVSSQTGCQIRVFHQPHDLGGKPPGLVGNEHMLILPQIKPLETQAGRHNRLLHRQGGEDLVLDAGAETDGANEYPRRLQEGPHIGHAAGNMHARPLRQPQNLRGRVLADHPELRPWMPFPDQGQDGIAKVHG